MAFFVFSVDTVFAAPVDDFVFTVQTDNTGTSTDTEFTIPIVGLGVNYDVDCDDNGVYEATGETSGYTCNYGSAGTYTIRITGSFQQVVFNNAGDKDKILSV